MTVKAIFENGMFKPRERRSTSKSIEAEVVIPATAPSEADDPTGWNTKEALIGFIDDAPVDTAEHHDDEYVGARL